MEFKQGKEKYNMDPQAASALLSNVLAACDRPEASVPLPEIVEEIAPKKSSFLLPKVIVSALFLFTFFMPLFFEHPPIIATQAVQNEDFYLDSDYVLNGNIFLAFYGQKIHPEKSVMVTESGMTFTATGYREERNTISFPYDATFGTCTITVCSEAGTEISVLISPREDS